MFKKSFLIILIQLAGSLLGVLSIYFIAGDMAPEVYSLVGVYNIVAALILTFSDLGLEHVMMREALYWIQHGDWDKVKEYASQAFLARGIGFLVLSPFLVAYLMFLNFTKYDGQYTVLMFVFLIGAAVHALNDSMSLIVRSQGGYVFSRLVSTINSYFIKFVGIPLYFAFGSNVYLYFYSLSSLLLFFVYLIKLRGVISFKRIHLRPTLRKIYDARYLWLQTDLDYVKNNADSLLVSALFPTSVMGSYTIFKSLENMAKSFIDGFFNVLSQNTVKYKGNEKALQSQEKKYKMACYAAIGVLCAGTALYLTNPSFWVNLVNLSKYTYIGEMVLCVALIAIIQVLGKYEVNALAFFASSRFNFVLGLAMSAATLASFLWVVALPTINGVLAQRLTAYAITSFVSIAVFRRHRHELYTEIKS